MVMGGIAVKIISYIFLMFPNRMHAQPRHSHSPSLTANLPSNQSSTESISYPNQLAQLKGICVRSENRVKGLEPLEIGDRVLEFSSGRKGKCRLRRGGEIGVGRGQGERGDDGDCSAMGQGYENGNPNTMQWQNFKKSHPQLPQCLSTKPQIKAAQVETTQTVRKPLPETNPTDRKRTQLANPQTERQQPSPKIINYSYNNSGQMQEEQRKGWEKMEKMEDIMMIKTKHIRQVSRNGIDGGSGLGVGVETRLTNKKIDRQGMDRLPLQPAKHYLTAITPTNIDHHLHKPSTYPPPHPHPQPLQTRIGLHPPHPQIPHLPLTKSTALETINSQLNLGLKLIDDSFQISGEDELLGCEGWVNVSMLGTYGYSTENSCGNGSQRCVKMEMEMEIQVDRVEEIVMDQSVVSPECMKLKEHLNSVLTSRELATSPQSLLSSIPLLQLPNFSSKWSSCSQLEPEPKAYSQTSLPLHILDIQNELIAVKEIGMVAHCSRYRVRYREEEIGWVLGALEKLVVAGGHANVIGVYGYSVSQVDHDNTATITVYKQPTLIPALHTKLHNLSNLHQRKQHLTHSLTLTRQNYKSLIRQLLSIVGYCRSLGFLRVEMENLYLCEDWGQGFGVRIDVGDLGGFGDGRGVEVGNLRTVGLLMDYLGCCVLEHQMQAEAKLRAHFAARLQDTIEALIQKQQECSELSAYGEYPSRPQPEDLLLHPYLALTSSSPIQLEILSTLY